MEDVIRMATLTPSERAGIEAESGSLEPGELADLTVLDAKLHVKSVYLSGQRVGSKI